MPPAEKDTDKSDSISASAPFSDPGLSQLRKQIKNIMIPLLIKVFQLRLEIQQTMAPPSRLYENDRKSDLPEIVEELQRLDKDLELLQVWCHSCRSRIEKVLDEAGREESPSGNFIEARQKADPAMQKSFKAALAFERNPTRTVRPLHAPKAPKKRSWWHRLFD